MPHHWLKMAKTPNLLAPKEKIMGEGKRRGNFKRKNENKRETGKERVSQSRGLEKSDHPRILAGE